MGYTRETSDLERALADALSTEVATRKVRREPSSNDWPKARREDISTSIDAITAWAAPTCSLLNTSMKRQSATRRRSL